jgi:hypothetical protein
VTAGPVTAVLTGSDSSKRAYVEERATRKVIRDQGVYSPGDGPADNRWGWYALDYAKYMSWDGTSPTIPQAELDRLRCLVGDVHAKGAKLRFWNDPETTVFWKAEIETGVDLIGSDDLPRLNRVLSGTSP